MKKLSLIAFVSFLLSTFSNILCERRDYPDRPISIAACYPPWRVDRNLRMVEGASKYLGQSLLPQYKTGGSGTVAMQYIKHPRWL